MQEEQVTVWCTVASLARTVLEAGAPELILSDLKALKITGEPMFSSDFELFVGKTGPQARLHVGLTSTEVLVATENILEHGDQPERLLSIGWAVPPLRVGIVDEEGRELPPRTPGRLAYAGGALEPDESGWGYVSEDIAMMETSGRMTYLGRNDGMLKIAGNRIDIGDIEYNASMITGVRGCAAFPFDREDRTLLGLAVELQEKVDPDAMSKTIREELAHVLPRSVIPHRILVLDTIPRLGSAKPDRKALAAMIREMQTSEASDGQERLDDAQTEFLTLIRERGGMPSLGFDESFFDAGGDSISLLRIISDIEQRYDANIPFSILELEPTPRMLFQRVNRS